MKSNWYINIVIIIYGFQNYLSIYTLSGQIWICLSRQKTLSAINPLIELCLPLIIIESKYLFEWLCQLGTEQSTSFTNLINWLLLIQIFKYSNSPHANPLLVPAVRGVLEGLVSGLIQVLLPGQPSTLSAIIDPLSDALKRHANITIDLNQHTNQAKLVAAEKYLPSTLPIDIQMRNDFVSKKCSNHNKEESISVRGHSNMTSNNSNKIPLGSSIFDPTSPSKSQISQNNGH